MTKLPFVSSLLWVAAGLAISGLSSIAGAASSAELYSAKSFRYGRFVTRVQFAGGDGVVSSFFLWKDGSEKPETFWNELDIEKLGADCNLETNAYYGKPAKTHSQQAEQVPTDLCGGFHTYAYEWTPDYISWSVDGTEIRRETGDVATAYADNGEAGMQIRFNVWPGDATFGGDFSPSIMPVYQYVNWVEYYSYADDDFKLEWREDFDGATIPSGWLRGNWDSPKGLSTHDPKNVSIVNGFVVLSLTGDDALGAGDAAPEDREGTDDTEPNDSQGTGGTASDDSEAAGGRNTGTGGTTTSLAAENTTSAASTTTNSDSGACSVRDYRGGGGAQRTAFLLATAGILLAGRGLSSRRTGARRRNGVRR